MNSKELQYGWIRDTLIHHKCDQKPSTPDLSDLNLKPMTTQPNNPAEVRHDPLCRINMRCAVDHGGMPCSGPFGICNCRLSQPRPAAEENRRCFECGVVGAGPWEYGELSWPGGSEKVPVCRKCCGISKPSEGGTDCTPLDNKQGEIVDMDQSNVNKPLQNVTPSEGRP